VRPIEVDATFITIAWDAPAVDGGSPVTGYVVEKMDTKRGEYMFVANVDATTTQLKVTRLFEGLDYMFRVFAENPAGLSSPCETDKSIKAKLPFGESG
jgi:Fibronectin type III domain